MYRCAKMWFMTAHRQLKCCVKWRLSEINHIFNEDLYSSSCSGPQTRCWQNCFFFALFSVSNTIHHSKTSEEKNKKKWIVQKCAEFRFSLTIPNDAHFERRKHSTRLEVVNSIYKLSTGYCLRGGESITGKWDNSIFESWLFLKWQRFLKWSHGLHFIDDMNKSITNNAIDSIYSADSFRWSIPIDEYIQCTWNMHENGFENLLLSRAQSSCWFNYNGGRLWEVKYSNLGSGQFGSFRSELVGGKPRIINDVIISRVRKWIISKFIKSNYYSTFSYICYIIYI